MINNPQ